MGNTINTVKAYLAIFIFNLSFFIVFPLLLLSLLYAPGKQWASPDLQTTIYWFVTTVMAIITYYVGSRILAYAIGYERFTQQQLHRINAIMIYAIIAMFLLSVYFTQ